MKIKKSKLIQIIKEEVEDSLKSSDAQVSNAEFPDAKKSDIEGYISEEEAVKKIQSTNGKVFGVSFVKKDGTTRHMNARLHVKKYLRGGNLPYNPKEKQLIPVWDAQIKDKANAYRMINIKTITSVRVGGKKYVVNRDK